MWWRSLAMVLIGGVAACAPLTAQQQETVAGPQPPPSTTVFSHRVSTTHVVLYWNCTRPEPGKVRLEGLVYSPYYSDVRDLQFELAGVDSGDRAVSEARADPPDFVLGMNRTAPFQMTLQTTGSEVRFDLYYGYRAQGGLRSSLAGPPVVLAQSQSWFRARDACADTQRSYPRPFR
jgi:hypothetical protein